MRRCRSRADQAGKINIHRRAQITAAAQTSRVCTRGFPGASQLSDRWEAISAKLLRRMVQLGGNRKHTR